jgi:scyllo-inositol 2-dehydrogenase (NADP+)
MIRVGLAGYGLAGAVFHAPLIRSCGRMELAAVLSSREAPARVDDLSELFDRSDLVVVATPNATHYSIAKAALEAGKHVVIDKPFTASVEQADELIGLATAKQLKLSVFHNRRWDSDYLTLRSVLPRLGEIHLFEAAWDRFRPELRDSWKEAGDEANGVLPDLGSHLIDQALQLFGPPDAIQADLAAQREGSRIDDYFVVTLHYASMRAVLSASTMVADPRPRFAVHGKLGSFTKYGLDPQEQQLKDGLDPSSPDFGRDPLPGTLTGSDGLKEEVTGVRGDYSAFYEQMADAILTGSPPPVEPRDAREVMHVIELAKQSARQGRRLRFNGESMSCE